jgi:cytochrome b
MQRIRVWDIFVRAFHWSLVLAFAANALLVDTESDLHQWIGYGIMALISFRILWGFVGSKYAQFSSFPPSINRSLEQLTDIATGRHRLHLGHTPLGALMIYNLLITLAIIGLSGYLMTTNMFWGSEWTEELHEIAVGWAEISVVLHIIAVIYESKRSKVNLPKAMVTGYKEIP